MSQTGAAVTATDAGHNATLAAGQSASFGIQGTRSGSGAAPTPLTCTT